MRLRHSLIVLLYCRPLWRPSAPVSMWQSGPPTGGRHYFGYPITPQTEIAAYMAKKMPKIGGVFLQAESSIICPMVPSARIMEVMRYLSARLKPLTVRLAISCTEAGARTIMR